MTVRWLGRAELDTPLLVAGFEGWNDAGRAASDAVRWLVATLDAVDVAAVDADEATDHQASRPRLTITDGVLADLAWPGTRVLAARAEQDLVLVLGSEPNFGWRGYCTDVLDAARALGCRRAVTVGALLADAPHSRPVPVTGAATDPDLAARTGVKPSRYEGPTGIVGILHQACGAAGLPSASLWAAVPHYVATPPNPKATLALVERLDALCGLGLDLTGLDGAARAWEEQVATAVAGDPEVARYVAELEIAHDDAAADPGPTAGHAGDGPRAATSDAGWSDADLPSGDEIATELERFLRRGDDPPSPRPD